MKAKRKHWVTIILTAVILLIALSYNVIREVYVSIKLLHIPLKIPMAAQVTHVQGVYMPRGRYLIIFPTASTVSVKFRSQGASTRVRSDGNRSFEHGKSGFVDIVIEDHDYNNQAMTGEIVQIRLLP
jgi:hypothetical protein